jgi:glycosyltransferase involved in cell wall biosynthesis
VPDGAILQVSTSDRRGGAGNIARSLYQACRARGLPAWMAVGYPDADDPGVLRLPNDECRSRWARGCRRVAGRLTPLVGRVRGAARLQALVRWVGQPGRGLAALLGHEDFAFPGTWRLLDLPPRPPALVHGHNLHGAFFDLRALPRLSRQVPVLLTLHDAWLLSGHCAHSLDCRRWEAGCGRCPDLALYPAIRRDATAFNWRRKQKIYRASRVYVATPSDWLMQKVARSILSPAVVEGRVIPNGVALDIFRPGERRAAREALALPQEGLIALFSAPAARSNPWKDYASLRQALGMAAERLGDRAVLLVVLGDEGPAEQVGRAGIRFVPYQLAPEAVARHYQAADLCVHAARAETFPSTVMEALACGIPVVATAVGGVPEQVRSLEACTGLQPSGGTGPAEATGVLVPPGDPGRLAGAIVRLLESEPLRRQLGQNAAREAARRFDRRRCLDSYLDWYGQILERRRGAGGAA